MRKCLVDSEKVRTFAPQKWVLRWLVAINTLN